MIIIGLFISVIMISLATSFIVLLARKWNLESKWNTTWWAVRGFHYCEFCASFWFALTLSLVWIFFFNHSYHIGCAFLVLAVVPTNVPPLVYLITKER